MLKILGKNIKSDVLYISLFIIASVLILLAFLSPFIFTREALFDSLIFNDNSSHIGNTIGGLMTPFIALAGVMVTFLAFYVQYEANKKLKKELELQEHQNQISKIEGQFYEMLRLHKQNLSELELDISQPVDPNKINLVKIKTIKGRAVFEVLIKEFETAFYIADYYFINEKFNYTFKDLIEDSYKIFYLGVELHHHKSLEEKEFEELIYEQAISFIKERHKEYFYHDLPLYFRKFLKNITKINKVEYKLHYDIYSGHISKLAHYYRHLFQTVKFIANQPDKIFNYSEKRRLLRMLRAQLSNHEQVMLFYNWYSGFGKQWEDETNHFFTDYRMIHNLNKKLLINELELDSITEFKRDFMKEEGRSHDPLFEFEDWK